MEPLVTHATVVYSCFRNVVKHLQIDDEINFRLYVRYYVHLERNAVDIRAKKSSMKKLKFILTYGERWGIG